MLTPDSFAIAKSSLISSSIGDETIVLDGDCGTYFTLTGSGNRIWELLKERRKVLSICEVLRAEYDVPQERCQSDVLELLHKLNFHGLIEVDG